MSLLSVENVEDFTPPRTSTPKPISSTEAECKIDANVQMASVPDTVVESEAVAVSDTVGVRVTAAQTPRDSISCKSMPGNLRFN